MLDVFRLTMSIFFALITKQKWCKADWTQLGNEIVGEAASDYSGSAVSMNSDGTVIAVGAGSNDGNGNNAGHVRVHQYNSSNMSWSQMGDDIDGEADSDNSASVDAALSLNGDGTVVAIGAGWNDGDGSSNQIGHARVFKYNSVTMTWSQRGTDIDGENAGDQAGRVSLNNDGDIVAVGSPWNGDGGHRAGHVRVFQFNRTTNQWEQIGSNINGEVAEGYSGQQVQLNNAGDIVAIGAPLATTVNAGQVQVFQYISGNWTQLGLTLNGDVIGDRFGQSVSLSGSGHIVAIGASSATGDVSSSGHVQVWQYNATNMEWTQMGNTINGTAQWDAFGGVVELNDAGNVVAIGAEYHALNSSMFNTGQVRIFKYADNVWTQIGSNIDGANGDQAGTSAGISAAGYIVAVGSPRNDDGGAESGHVRVFQYPTPSPTTSPTSSPTSSPTAASKDDSKDDSKRACCSITFVIGIVAFLNVILH